MKKNRFKSWCRVPSAALLGLALLCALAACGGSSNSTDEPAGQSPPTAPAASGTATLAWNASLGTRVTGYRVYYGLETSAYVQSYGAGVNVGLADSHVVTGLSAGTQYYFAVTAVDASGNESAYSNEASTVVGD